MSSRRPAPTGPAPAGTAPAGNPARPAASRRKGPMPGLRRAISDRLFDPRLPDSLLDAAIRLDDPDPQDRRLREAAPTQEDWYWGRSSITGSEEDYYWRRISDNYSQKDVLPGTYLELHNQCYEAYNANPMANAIVEMGVNFTLGEGLQVDARNKKVQRILDAFWDDPDNHMNRRQFDLATELSLYGEIFVRFFVNPFDGHVKIAFLDPSLVDQIDTDPENVERELRVHRRPLAQNSTVPTASVMPTPAQTATGPGGYGSQINMLQPSVVAPSDPRWTEGQWFHVPGEIMHFTVNKVTNAKRGKSDLATLLPWLRRYKDWLIDRVRINKYKAAFLWDVTLAGADRQTIDQKMMAYARPPEPGSVLVHNESETWQAVQPMIDASSAAPDGHAMKMMIAMGAGLPEHYLAEGGDVNRATAAEMGLPTLKRYRRRQDYIGHILHQILDRVIAEAQNAGQIPRGADTGYAIHFPELLTDDAKDIGYATHQMSQALATARGLGIVSEETASRMFFEFARTEIDVAEELQRVQSERPAGAPRGAAHPGDNPITSDQQ
ncbi:MAG: hypothetical protein NVS4B2_26400 [Chloroflexota bacterium]